MDFGNWTLGKVLAKMNSAKGQIYRPESQIYRPEELQSNRKEED